MNKLLLFFILFSIPAWSKVNLELRLNSPSVKQGQIALGSLVVKSTDGNAGLSGLKGQTLGKTLYLYNVAPFMGKQGQLVSEVKVIFAQMPQSQMVSETINNEEVTISWSGIEVSPTEESKSFIFGDFEIPSRLVMFPWIMAVLGIGLLSLVIIRVRLLLRNKSSIKTKKLKLRDEIINCSSYDDVVLMWRQKKRYLDEFPMLEQHFKTLEVVLFKYQFKSQRTEREVEAVLEAYQGFKSSVMGDLNGI